MYSALSISCGCFKAAWENIIPLRNEPKRSFDVGETNNLEAGVSNFLQYWGLLFKLRPFSRVISEIYLKTQFGPNSLLPCSSNAVVRSVPNMNQVTALHLNTWLENCMQFFEFFEKMYKNECWAKLQFHGKILLEYTVIRKAASLTSVLEALITN